MQSHDLRIDITGCVDLDGPLQTAATVHLPDRIDGPLTVLVGLPGGSYARGYYDIGLLPGYSQAEYHTEQGCALVACDHIGIGDSTAVDPFDLTIERMTGANHAAISKVIAGLRAGTLIEGVGPIAVEKVVGMGQSMGGCLVTAQQGLHRTFDAIAVLGYGVASSSFPLPDGSRIAFPAPARNADLRAGAGQVLGTVAQQAEMLRYSFHAADTEPELLEADMGSSPGIPAAPWRSAFAPPCAAMMMADGAVAREAAMIDVPVLAGSGEIDLVSDPWAEPAAFRGSRDVAVFVVPGMAHMHNFARTRELLWERIARFAASVAPG